MEATASWEHGMRFTATADSGFSVQLDAGPAAGGEGAGFRPIELMLVSLASCTAMDVMSILRKKQQDVTGLQVKAHADRAADHPKVFTDILLEYIVRGRSVDPRAVKRAIELSEGKYCPAQAMLCQTVPIRHIFQIVEE